VFEWLEGENDYEITKVKNNDGSFEGVFAYSLFEFAK
jgi:hypothetical protein